MGLQEFFTADFGMGENISVGFAVTYLLAPEDKSGIGPSFEDRADVKARFNANIGNFLGFSPKMDLYP